MGYRLAAGGLAGRLRAGDGGTGPCLEDAWVKRTARFWMGISQVAARAVPMDGVARSLAAARDGALMRVRSLPSFKLPSVSLPSTKLPILDICQGAAALTVIAIGSSTLVCWKESHAQRQLPVRAQALAVAAPGVPAKARNKPIQVASLSPPLAAAPAIAKPAAATVQALPAPPPVLAEATPAILAPPPIAPPPAVMLADDAAPPAPARAMHAARAQEPALAPRLATAPRIALAPRIFSVLATRPLPRPRHPTHVVAARYEMPHWLTEPRAPLVMSEPPHALSLPPHSAQPSQSVRSYPAPSRYAPPLLERPRVDRFAEGTYVPPMMPGMYR